MFNGMILEGSLNPGNGRLVGHLAVHEAAAGALLHDLRSVVPGDAAEGLAAVDDRVVDDLSIGEQKAAVRCWWTKK